MARGWESKAVEEQLNARDARGRDDAKEAKRLSDAERIRQSELGSLQLSRSRIASQLARATNPAHRQMLERALAALDEQIGAKS